MSACTISYKIALTDSPSLLAEPGSLFQNQEVSARFASGLRPSDPPARPSRGVASWQPGLEDGLSIAGQLLEEHIHCRSVLVHLGDNTDPIAKGENRQTSRCDRVFSCPAINE